MTFPLVARLKSAWENPQLLDVKLFAFMLFNISVMSFGLVLLMTAVFSVAHAQPVDVGDLGRRMNNMEALNLDHRLTIIETMVTTEHWTHMGTMVGTALLILERGARAINGKIRETDE